MSGGIVAAAGAALAVIAVIALVRGARPAGEPDATRGDAPGAATPRPASAPGPETFRMARERLVNVLRGEGIRDERVLRAIGRVPRERFVPPPLQGEAYENYPLSIGHEQTISQPYVVAFMTEAARVGPGSRVLEIGTGSGYQAAILADVLGLGPAGPETGAADGERSRLASIEILAPLAAQARSVLESLGYRVDLRVGDGYRGWPELAPFDAIVVTAAPGHVPQPLVDQLAVGGRLVIPVGEGSQDLRVLTRTAEGVREVSLLPVRFVPMTGEAEAGAK